MQCEAEASFFHPFSNFQKEARDTQAASGALRK
jgi:hypothetical protein